MDGTTISVSKLRQNTAKVIDYVVKMGQPLTIFQRSEPKVIIADFKYFKALEDAVFDLSDSKEAEKAKKEPRVSFRTYMEKRWGSDSV